MSKDCSGSEIAPLELALAVSGPVVGGGGREGRGMEGNGGEWRGMEGNGGEWRGGGGEGKGKERKQGRKEVHLSWKVVEKMCFFSQKLSHDPQEMTFLLLKN